GLQLFNFALVPDALNFLPTDFALEFLQSRQLAVEFTATVRTGNVVLGGGVLGNLISVAISTMITAMMIAPIAMITSIAIITMIAITGMIIITGMIGVVFSTMVPVAISILAVRI